jgi:glucosamine--fructose-6-phosphate aminotransferase (isomerizing)
VAHWQGDATLLQALDQLPAQLQQACRQDWSAAIPVLSQAERIMVVGRGLGFAVALEAALKFKKPVPSRPRLFPVQKSNMARWP